mmetsp:Transcript_3937/g.13739  ORF Transcript_3937/g.13739 Transcript_3937/m.13739 type:complete len:256 (-) Transcript_3937:1467-2234(-)
MLPSHCEVLRAAQGIFRSRLERRGALPEVSAGECLRFNPLFRFIGADPEELAIAVLPFEVHRDQHAFGLRLFRKARFIPGVDEPDVAHARLAVDLARPEDVDHSTSRAPRDDVRLGLPKGDDDLPHRVDVLGLRAHFERDRLRLLCDDPICVSLFDPLRPHARVRVRRPVLLPRRHLHLLRPLLKQPHPGLLVVDKVVSWVRFISSPAVHGRPLLPPLCLRGLRAALDERRAGRGRRARGLVQEAGSTRKGQGRR